MTYLLPNNDTYLDDIEGLEDGKPANALYLNFPHQQIADRTTWLKNTVDAMGTRDGVTRVRYVPDTAALAALTGVVPGDVCQVGILGTFIFEVLVDLMIPGWVVESTSMPGLFWQHSLLGMTFGDVSRRLVTTVDARIPSHLPRNGVVKLAAGGKGANGLVNSTETTLHTLALGGLESGDVIDVSAAVGVALADDPASHVVVRLALFRNGVEVTYDPGDAIQVATGFLRKLTPADYINITGRYFVKSAGNHEVRLIAERIGGGDQWAIISNGQTSTVYRP